jgi:hypothetical protein
MARYTFKLFMQGVFVCGSVFILYGATLFAADINATITTGLFVPLKPVNLGVVVGESSVSLSWSTPLSDGGTAILDYVVEYKLSSSGFWSVYTEGISTDTFTSVIGLTNDTSYDFRVSAVNGIGQGPASTAVTAAPGVPATVQIITMSDTLLPDVGAQVRITNTGSIAYTYSFTWCVTNALLNVCGDDNDVFSSSSVVMVATGESWESILPATLGTSGQYYLHLEVQFGSDISRTSELFTAETEPVDEEEIVTQSSSSSGNVCRGADFNRDGDVTGIDYAILKYFFNTTRQTQNKCVDLNDDTSINASDFSIFLTKWK